MTTNIQLVICGLYGKCEEKIVTTWEERCWERSGKHSYRSKQRKTLSNRPKVVRHVVMVGRFKGDPPQDSSWCLYILTASLLRHKSPSLSWQCQDCLVHSMSEFVLPLLGPWLNISLIISRNHCVIKMSPKFTQTFKVMHQKQYCK
jgi:hypothetical protein